MSKNIYSKKFYEKIDEGSLKSAKKIVPLIIKLFNPKSVVDIGCGTGAWLSVFKENKIRNIIGIDGNYINKALLHISEKEFLERDLRDEIKINKIFDLAICLEVGEHIVKPKSEILVKSLCNLAPIIIFSAGIPGQGGNNHINEQWPDYWKNIFLKFGYLMFDPIRKEIYNDPEIEWWYRQNIFVFIRKDKVNDYKKIKGFTKPKDIMMIHKSILRKHFGLKNKIIYLLKKSLFRIKDIIII